MISFMLVYTYMFICFTLFGMYRDTKYYKILLRINVFNIGLFFLYLFGHTGYVMFFK